jgi:hypothetical protein
VIMKSYNARSHRRAVRSQSALDRMGRLGPRSHVNAVKIGKVPITPRFVLSLR